jgi:hypothetical protein
MPNLRKSALSKLQSLHAINYEVTKIGTTANASLYLLYICVCIDNQLNTNLFYLWLLPPLILREKERERERDSLFHLHYLFIGNFGIDWLTWCKYVKKRSFFRLYIHQQIWEILDFLKIPAISMSDNLSYSTCAIFLVKGVPEIYPFKVVSGLCGHPVYVD